MVGVVLNSVSIAHQLASELRKCVLAGTGGEMLHAGRNPSVETKAAEDNTPKR